MTPKKRDKGMELHLVPNGLGDERRILFGLKQGTPAVFLMYPRDAPNLKVTKRETGALVDELRQAVESGTVPRFYVALLGFTLSPTEDELLTRLEKGDTGPEFWQAVKRAGLFYEPGKQGKRRHAQGPTAVGTYPELAVLGFAAADARTGQHWIEAPGGGALVHLRKKAGMQVRFVPSMGGDRWADRAPSMASDDLFAILAANGGLDTVFLAQVGADFAIEHEHEEVSLDDLGRLIGRNPRTKKEREAMRRDIWERLKFLDGITVWGVRKGTYRDPSTGQKVPIESRDALFLISGAMWPEQGTLDGTDVPLKVKFGAGPLLATYRGHPEVLTSLGDYQRLAAIPGEKPSGAWARSMGLALTQRWRERASYGGVRKFTRRYLLTQFPPAPSVDEILQTDKPYRARRYFTQALAILKARGVIASYSEPDPAPLPRTGWADVWLQQTVEVTPPPALLEASAGMSSTREQAEEKAAQAQKRRRHKTERPAK
jgi:hypothetical protein